MLDQERISIGKLKTAYRLNAHDADVHLAAFVRKGCLDVYSLWQEAVRFVAVEENNKKSIYDEVIEPYFPDTSDMGQGPLEGRILAKRLLRHFLYSARSGAPRERLQRIFDRVLNFAYDYPDEQQMLSANSILDLLYEQRMFGFHGNGKVDIAAGEYASPELFVAFCGFFDDAISVNKEAAVRHMDVSGYPQVQEVKGLSFALAKRILATPITKSQVKSVTETPAAHPQNDVPQNPSPSVILVPRALWEGKSPKSVRDNMRQPDKDFPDHVIAYVLYHWCDLKNRTEIGTLLGKSGKDPSTYLRHANRLLAKAEGLNIQPA